MSFHDHAFRALMRLLPAEFRGEYGREMRATFRAERSFSEGSLGLVRLWAATIADVLRVAPAEHLDILARDLSYTVRILARRPTLTLTATLTLALGIGANTAIFSVVDGVLLAALPYPEPERLVLAQEDAADDEPGRTGYYSFEELRSRQQSFEGLAAMSAWSAILTGDGGDAERVNGTRVTWDFFRVLGVRPALGRDFEQHEDHPERRRVALLSDGLWRRRFQADPGVVGKPVTINGLPYTVAGVMPSALNEIVTTRTFPGTEIWSLLGYRPELPQACRDCRHISMMGRVKAGVPIAQAEADLTRIYQSLDAEFPGDYAEPRAALLPIREHFLGPAKPALLLLWGAVGLLLLMACANIANLLLIRATEREGEIAIRKALGVTPARLLRQLLTESVLLAVMGGAAGTLLAWWGTSALTAYGPDDIPRLREVAVNARALLYAIGISVVTGVVFGMAPARMLILRGAGALVGGSRTTGSAGAWRLRAALVAANVALSTLLLVGSGLLVRSFLHLITVEPGFDPRGVLTMEMDLAGKAYDEIPGIARFYEELTARIGALPGVTSVGAATQLPLTDSSDRWGITVEGRPLENPAAGPEADRYGVTADYVRAMRIPLLRGRLLTPADGMGTTPVVLIGKTMADQLWPGEDPIGRRVRLAGGPNNPMRTIVGVVGDVRHYGLHVPVTLQAYMPQVQAPWPQWSMTMVVRVEDGRDPLSIAGAVREQVRAIDAHQPVTRLRTYDAIVATSMATRRFTLVLLALFAGTALVLAVVGLYGALSYVVGQREREIGVRVALGARGEDIRRLVVGQGMRPAIAGLALGLTAASMAGRLLETMLFEVSMRDAATFAAVLGVVGLSALLACLLPARQAARIDPAVTLRAE